MLQHIKECYYAKIEKKEHFFVLAFNHLSQSCCFNIMIYLDFNVQSSAMYHEHYIKYQ